MHTPKLIILTNCSERKRGNLQALRLRNFKGDLTDRAKQWCIELERSAHPRTSAIDLYQGDHWASVLSLVRVAEQTGWDANLWVASAGYGLIPTHAQIVPYAATFGSGHPDSVWCPAESSAKNAGRNWWDALSHWCGPNPGQPRTLSELASQNPTSRWLVVMSPNYLDAISKDLVEATSHLETPEGLLVVSGKPGPRDMRLIANWIPALDKCRLRLGGSCNSLNARIGVQLLRTFSAKRWLAPIVQPEANLWMAGLEPMDRPSRSKIADAEAMSFIQTALTEDLTVSHTKLLRKLRENGIACEQKRFRDLFMAIKTGQR